MTQGADRPLQSPLHISEMACAGLPSSTHATHSHSFLCAESLPGLRRDAPPALALACPKPLHSLNQQKLARGQVD